MKALTAGSVLALGVAGVGAQAEAARKGVVRLAGLAGSARSLVVAAAALHAGRSVVVTADDSTAAALRLDLQALLPELAGAADVSAPEILLFPALEADPYQGIGAHPQVLAARAATLSRLRRASRWMVIAPFASLLAPLLAPDRFDALFLRLGRGGTMPFESLAGRLEAAGFVRVDLASSPGEWARRGGIFDVFPPGLAEPVRIELEDDRIASLRLFDPMTQRSLEQRESVEIPPAREAPLGPDERRDLMRRLEKMPRIGGRALGTDPLEALALTGTFPGIELCAGLWAGRETDLMDYAAGALLVADEPFRLETEMEAEMGDLAAAREAAGGGALPPPERLLVPRARLAARLAGPRLELHELALHDDEHVDVGARAARVYFGKLGDLAADIERAVAGGRRTLLLLDAEGMMERACEVLRERGLSPVTLPATIPPGGSPPLISLARARLGHGFELPDAGLMVLTETDVFGDHRRQAPRGGRRVAAFKSDFRDLAIGDLVVHVDHGIGRFQGIRRMAQAGGEREFMVLIYRDDAVLYVPVERLDLVGRYSGVGGAQPRLDRLGTGGWEKVRGRVKREVQKLADDLLQLYAARKALPGRAAGPETAWQKEFEAAFPFRETPDQMQAILDVKHDMESPANMDRLICGDVGFGKTEVAMRAAFKAVMSGCQVAVLAPTTVLAFQHFNTFRDRFAAFPVTVEMLSRFQGRADQKRVIERLKSGEVDVIIGTHRLLSADVGFRHLGLLVIDEEQRFGVAHKERLKKIRQAVDVLTLTATPIPRTLQMSLAGVSDLSVIETPPENRLSIQTLLLPFRPAVMAQAIRREVRRGGQVYFVHNRIGSIAAMASVIRRHVPDVTLDVMHGQMQEKHLEQVMLRFLAGEFQVLLTTSIIENGLDIPRVNTIIVNRADRFGLSQLYQLRGRVGRSDVRAYAYLLIPPQRKLTGVARKRLRALQEFSELGAGFRIAARDLEIRGSGELLGARQHGHIAALGFDLYCRMLEEAVAEKRGEAAPTEVRVTLDLGVDVRLPEDYVAEAHQRLVLYKRVAAAAEAGDLERVRDEIEDRYGHLPVQAENLLALAEVRVLAERLGIAEVRGAQGSLSFHFVDAAPLDPGRLLQWVRGCPGATLSPAGQVRLRSSSGPEERLRQAHAYLTDLSARCAVRGAAGESSTPRPS